MLVARVEKEFLNRKHLFYNKTSFKSRWKLLRSEFNSKIKIEFIAKLLMHLKYIYLMV